MVRNEEHTAMPKKLTCAPRGGELMLLLGKNVANCLSQTGEDMCAKRLDCHAKIGSRGTGARGGHRGLEAGVGGW